ncbi:MAG: DUF262 domain-containing protein, partial [Chloroflexi bacterium]|nr:DUF262 domain-containing protein [Chloroflexota bacterium]
WYLACRADRLEQEHGWKHFEYATRPSARRFCERLVESKPPLNRKLREWFEDQYWFLHTWQHDPTIQSMLTMIEAIHKQFIDTDCDAAWRRLVESEPPVISFHVLPIKEMELSEDLYIKMNSRGKPLTDFENFKARFEQLLEHSHPPQKVKDFAHKVDVAWVDLLWPFKGSDNTVDNEFLRYFEFVSDICEWSDGQHPVGGDIRNLAKRVYAKAEHVYGPENERAEAHLDFLVRSFDTWVRVDVPTVFSELLTRTPAPVDTDNTHKLVLFGRWNSENLFRECCRDRDRESRSLPLLLYAFLLNLLEATNEFPRRLRMLRNLIEASSNQIRAQNMPALIDDVRSLIVNGNLSKVSNFNGLQVGNEQRKFEFLSKNPTLEGALFRLEDHDLLRGSLAAFEPLDASVFERRARAFHELFDDANLLLDFTGALLAAGDYSRVKHGKSMLGSGSNMRQWREEIFTGYSRERLVSLATVRPALVHILDIVAEQKGDVQAALRSFTKAWLEDKEAEKAANGLDWRWYFVRYEEMRKGHSGIYAHETRSLGYSVCMLEKRMMHSYYRDPYLSAIRQESGVSDSNVQGEKWQEWGGGPWFTGHESKERWMELKASRTAMRCVQSGIQLRKPDGESCRKTFLRVCNAHGVDSDDLKLKIPQTTVDGHQLDTEDRVRLGGALLRDLVAKGL